MNWDPISLREEAKKEIYKLIDKHLKKLPKNKDGSINDLSEGFEDNDVDALRHAYVSGVFTQEYGEITSSIFGRLNEVFPGGGVSSSNSENAINMDLWNNAVGRKYGKESKSRKKLFQHLINAMKEGELIIDINTDSRKYTEAGEIKSNIKGFVIVLNEDKKGKNSMFYDLSNKKIMNRDEFVSLIKNGSYPNYELRIVNRLEIPVAKKDKSLVNNLG